MTETPIKKCYFCGETNEAKLYNRHNQKVCSLCIKVILEIVDDYKELQRELKQGKEANT